MSNQTQTDQTATSTTVQAVQNPLTLIMDIKSEQDYQQLDAMIRQLNPSVSLNKVGTVHFARFVFLQNNTQLAVITTFDGDLEDYANDFVDAVGDIFDALLSHVKDAPPLPVANNRDVFIEYIKKYNVEPVIPMYSAYPDLTVKLIHNLASQ